MNEEKNNAELQEGLEVPLVFNEMQEDDESLVNLTPEEAAELLKKREEKARQDKERYEKLKKDGEAALDNGDYKTARECFSKANEIFTDELDLNVGYMRAYSEDFTAFKDFETVMEVYEQCFESAGEPFAKRVKEGFGEKLQAQLTEWKKEEAQVSASFTAAQSERREFFSARAKKQNGALLKLSIPFFPALLVCVLSLCFINAIEGNLFVILAVVFGAIAAILLIPTLIAAKNAMNANRLLRENEDIYSTQEGRSLARLRNRIEGISFILNLV